ncbi:MAG: hypothetical protein BGP13_22365 [Sphingobacteriales bacterium 40-81]|nr:MAG: hypothetical protein BGP13_22365 [Sphingobacteriales bacterium 40-81]
MLKTPSYRVPNLIQEKYKDDIKMVCCKNSGLMGYIIWLNRRNAILLLCRVAPYRANKTGAFFYKQVAATRQGIY